MSGDGLWSEVGSEIFQPELFGVAFQFGLSLVPLSASAWFCSGNCTGIKMVSLLGLAACEMGLAAATVSGGLGIGDIMVCSRWCFLLCAL